MVYCGVWITNVSYRFRDPSELHFYEDTLPRNSHPFRWARRLSLVCCIDTYRVRISQFGQTSMWMECAPHPYSNPHSRVFPEWKLDADFLIQHFFRARALDAKLSSHPVEVECPDANMINQVSHTPNSPPAVNSIIIACRSSTACHMRRQLRVRVVILKDHSIELKFFSAPHACELRRRGPLPQGCLHLPEEAYVQEQRH